MRANTVSHGAGIASMTGYGRAEGRGTRSAVTVEVRSLNHRFLDIAIRLGRAFTVHEQDLRRLTQDCVARGRIDLAASVRATGGSPSMVRTDLALGGQYVASARALGESLGVPGGLTVADVLRLPGVVTLEEAEEDQDELRALLRDTTLQALEELVRMRRAEGAALASELGTHLGALEAWVAALEGLLPEILTRIRDRVCGRVRELLGEAAVDPARIAQEAAVWAAKSDVAEELGRLRSHVAQFRGLLAAGGAVGRQMEFLAQEMHREVNTVGSKADDGEMVGRLLEGRTLVERLREQVQNVE